MKRGWIFVSLILCATVNTSWAGPPDKARPNKPVTLTVTVTKVTSARGKVSIGVYSSKRGWPKKGSELIGRAVAARKGEVSHVFEGLKPGRYAVAVFHDVNNNGKLDKNFFGVPKEGYGFSRDASARFGAPDFVDAALSLGKKGKSITLKMRY